MKQQSLRSRWRVPDNSSFHAKIKEEIEDIGGRRPAGFGFEVPEGDSKPGCRRQSQDAPGGGVQLPEQQGDDADQQRGHHQATDYLRSREGHRPVGLLLDLFNRDDEVNLIGDHRRGVLHHAEIFAIDGEIGAESGAGLAHH